MYQKSDDRGEKKDSFVGRLLYKRIFSHLKDYTDISRIKKNVEFGKSEKNNNKN